MDTISPDIVMNKRFRPTLHTRGKNAHNKQLVTVRNVTFGAGDDWMTSYAEVYAVGYKKIGELLFKGRLDDCLKFIQKHGHETTAAPTTPTMPISRYVPPRRNNPK